MTPFLELHDLGCTRGDRVLFSGICAMLPSGRLMQVRGSNGSGKTSLLRIICGLGRPDTGKVLWQGRSIAGHREEFNRALVYLGHSPALKDDLSAFENLQVCNGLTGAMNSSHSLLQALDATGLGAQAHLPARLLSQGQRKRVGMARLALSASSPLWILDEPFNALDTSACTLLRELVGAHLSRGGAVVLTSHLDHTCDPDWRTIPLDLDASRAGAGEWRAGEVSTAVALEAAWN